MRLGLSLAVLGILLGGAATPALAQNQQQQQGYAYSGNYDYNVPVYNGNSNYSAQTGGNPYFNSGSNLQMLNMQAMVAGKNAPSYNYGGSDSQPYTMGGFGNRPGGLSPQEAQAIRAQRDQKAAMYQQQYLESLRQQNMNNPYANVGNQPMAGSQYQGSQFSQLYAENNQPKKPVKRKVLYNQMNNPLVEPPRLFNPDQ